MAIVLSIAKVTDFDQFLKTFSTKGLEKRTQHGSQGSRVFRDPDDPNRALVVFEWDEDGYQELLSDPEMPEIFKEGGLEGRPVKAEPAGEFEA
jgi:heme-degrading monooxygenase HmoA